LNVLSVHLCCLVKFFTTLARKIEYSFWGRVNQSCVLTLSRLIFNHITVSAIFLCLHDYSINWLFKTNDCSALCAINWSNYFVPCFLTVFDLIHILVLSVKIYYFLIFLHSCIIFDKFNLLIMCFDQLIFLHC